MGSAGAHTQNQHWQVGATLLRLGAAGLLCCVGVPEWSFRGLSLLPLEVRPLEVYLHTGWCGTFSEKGFSLKRHLFSFLGLRAGTPAPPR